MLRVVIAGGGFGGIATAVELRRRHVPEKLDIVLVDRRADFVMGLRKTWAALGIAPLADGRRSLSQLRDVSVQIGEIERVDAENRQLLVNGRPIDGDSLVIALGARHALDTVPGLADHGINVWDPAQADRARAALSRLTAGRLAVGIFGMPYSCPPAPFELALLARERLGPAVEIFVFSPAPIALPVVGKAESGKLERLLDEAGIAFLRGRQATSVSQHLVEFADGSSESFDVLLAVPPHRCPQVLVDAALAEPGGWVKPDPRTLETQYEGVYAIGDCTVMPLASGLALPKAGVIAEQEGGVVAARLAARYAGLTPDATYSGAAFCYLETGGGRAAMASGSFYADPPAVTISEPSAAALADKREFERSRLGAWFGARTD